MVRAEITGRTGMAVVRLALDTGATRTLINAGLLVAVDYDPAATLERTEVTTGSGVEFAALVSISKIIAVELERTEFPVLAHTLPPSAGVEGVLGLDFLCGHVPQIDFQNGRLTLDGPMDEREPEKAGAARFARQRISAIGGRQAF